MSDQLINDTLEQSVLYCAGLNAVPSSEILSVLDEYGVPKREPSLLSRLFLDLKAKYQLPSMEELDRFVYFRMYEKMPVHSEAIKIRFWRTGLHRPANRREMIRLGFALELNAEQMNLLLKTSFQEPGLYLLNLEELVCTALFSSGHSYSFSQAEELIRYYQMLFFHPEEQNDDPIPVNSYLTSSLSEQLEHYYDQNRQISDRMLLDFPQLTSKKASAASADTSFLMINQEQFPPIPDSGAWMSDERWIAASRTWMQTHRKLFDYAHLKQQRTLIALALDYLSAVPHRQLQKLNVIPGEQYHYLRHILYIDALDCIWQNSPPGWDIYKNHGYSQNFSSELQHYFKHPELISRDTLIRLLLLLTMPDINAESLNQLLKQMEFAPLTPGLRNQSGACTDLFLLVLFNFFEKNRTGSREKDTAEFHRILRLADRMVLQVCQKYCNKKETKKSLPVRSLRIMKFRSLGETEL